MGYTPKLGCCALNNSVFKKESLRNISHDNDEIANSCIMAQHFLLILTLQYNITYVSEICVLVHVVNILHPSSEILKAAVAHSQQLFKKN